MKLPRFKIPQFLRKKPLEETPDYIIRKDIVGGNIECKHCGAISYDPEHIRDRECYNCGFGKGERL